MAVVQPLELNGGADQSEILFGFVASVGTPSTVVPYMRDWLTNRGYRVELIRVSELLQGFKLNSPYPPGNANEYDRIRMLMDRGDEFRKVSNRSEALALRVAAAIKEKRSSPGTPVVAKRAFLIHQLKHPDEVLWLRHIYGDAFNLVGLYSPRAARKQFLVKVKFMSDEQAEALIRRDQEGENKWGQQLRRTFYLADVFVEMREDRSSTDYAYKQTDRFLDLILGQKLLTPTRDEYGMYLAQAAGLRSADLSRQVGAAILDGWDVVSLGTNEVPAAGGGQYTGEEGKPDHRDFKKGRDFNEVKKREVIEEILAEYDQNWIAHSREQRENFLEMLDSTRAANLIEFGRAVHAEMEAILSAARRGIGIKGTTLYSTTFPCHTCAKHIVGGGLREVFYIEPYPKSLAEDMHDDSIGFFEDLDPNTVYGDQKSPVTGGTPLPTDKVWFRPFVGIAPRRYPVVFSNMSPEGERNKRKLKGGNVSPYPVGPRLRPAFTSYLEREALAASEADALAPKE